ncbi:MAG TPA: hypothetical protein VFS27_02210 [Blastocatellia bacterium]|nr:hypothetical protein [Blastocatellia bacterium]
MKQEKVLGFLILSEFVLGILATISYHSLEPFLPASLRTYQAAPGIAAVRFGVTLLWGLWIVVVVTTIIAWIGLLNLVRAARPLYLASWVGYFALLLLEGRTVSAWGALLIEMMTALVGGAILGMIYFSELGAKFRPLSVLAGAKKENIA